MASEYSGKDKEKPLERTVRFEGFHGILGAGRNESATARSEERSEKPVKKMQNVQQNEINSDSFVHGIRFPSSTISLRLTTNASVIYPGLLPDAEQRLLGAAQITPLASHAGTNHYIDAFA